MEVLLEEAEARPVPILEDRPAAARRAVTALFFVNGALFATWVSRIPAIEGSHGLDHATFGLALLVAAMGAVISMPVTGAVSARFGTGRICKRSLEIGENNSTTNWVCSPPQNPVRERLNTN